jgi:hypothetical protein
VNIAGRNQAAVQALSIPARWRGTIPYGRLAVPQIDMGMVGFMKRSVPACQWEREVGMRGLLGGTLALGKDYQTAALK